MGTSFPSAAGDRPLLHAFEDIVAYATQLLAHAGLDGDKPRVIAERLALADAMGHTTHGLALLAPYLAEIEKGSMSRAGDPEVVVDRPAAIVWDGRRLPGVWLTAKAMELAIERAKVFGTCTIAVRRSHHIACLAAYLPIALEAGMMAVVACSDPAITHVAPYGGKKAVFTPDPVAVGIPTDGDPVLIDISASITTAGRCGRALAAGERLPGLWAIDADGQATDDPSILASEPRGALLPTGGIDHGHKGYALALWIEALTQGLSGWGRADAPIGWSGAVFVQVFDPALFAGADEFRRQTGWLAEACRTSPPIDPARPVRLPGAWALAGIARAKSEGLALQPGIVQSLLPWAEKWGLPPLAD